MHLYAKIFDSPYSSSGQRFFFFTPDCISGVSPSQLLGTELVLAFLIIEEQVFLDFRAAIWK